jgi:hypothetical protein
MVEERYEMNSEMKLSDEANMARFLSYGYGGLNWELELALLFNGQELRSPARAKAKKALIFTRSFFSEKRTASNDPSALRASVHHDHFLSTRLELKLELAPSRSKGGD